MFITNVFKMFSLFLVILGLTSSLANDYQMCQNFLKENPDRIGIYKKFTTNGLKDNEEYYLFKYNSNEIRQISFKLDHSKNVNIDISGKSSELTDTNDVYKFSLDTNHRIWNCSVKYVYF